MFLSIHDLQEEVDFLAIVRLLKACSFQFTTSKRRSTVSKDHVDQLLFLSIHDLQEEVDKSSEDVIPSILAFQFTTSKRRSTLSHRR